MRETKKKLLQETTAILKKLDRESLAIIRSNAEILRARDTPEAISNPVVVLDCDSDDE